MSDGQKRGLFMQIVNGNVECEVFELRVDGVKLKQ